MSPYCRSHLKPLAAALLAAFAGTAMAETSLTGLTAAGVDYSYALGVSADGTTMVGEIDLTSGAYHAFRWVNGSLTDLGTLGGTNSDARGVSADGAVVVGGSDITGDAAQHAFRWAAGSMSDLGTLGGTESGANGVSADGAVVVGDSYITGNAARHAFRWAAGSMSDLGTLGGTESFARGVSADGAVVVGRSDITGNTAYHAFRWAAGSMSDLGTLGGTESFARGVSADGAVVVGWSFITGNTASHAFRWTQATGMQGVDQWLSGAGVNVGGWTFADATAANSDGSVVVGYGQLNGSNDQAYIARVGWANGANGANGSSGVVGLTDLAQSLTQTVSLPSQSVQLTSLTLNGAHHRTLMDMPMANRSECAWASGDIGRVYRNGNGYIGIAEAGACHDFADRQVRVGLGVGTGRSGIDLANDGHGRFQGEYVLGEADWAIPNTPLIASLLGYYARWDADLTRGYASAGTVASSGSTDMDDVSLRARLDWKDAFALGQVRFTPTVAYTHSRTKVDGYSETGGSAPATFGDRSHNARELRATLAGLYALNDKTDLRGTLEAVHRFDSESDSQAVSNVLGVITVATNIAGSSIRQNWVRVGAEIDHRFSERSLISVSGNVASAGQDADLSAAVSYKYLF